MLSQTTYDRACKNFEQIYHIELNEDNVYGK
jgi:hypothetical protein